jgi:hypothetical protein
MLDNFWQSVRNKGVEVVVHGSAHIEPKGKRDPAELVQDAVKIAKRQVQVLATLEDNTTKLCAGCRKEAEKCGKRHRSIRRRSTECFEQRRRCRKERDVKACKNIRYVGISLEEHGEVSFSTLSTHIQQCSSWCPRRPEAVPRAA